MNKSLHKGYVRKWTLWAAGIIACVAALLWLLLATSITAERSIDAAEAETIDKPVIVLLFDSLMSEPLQRAIQEGRAPAFSYLMDRGDYHPNIVSSYPTMSVTIDSTLLTGSYADQHHVPGLLWFDEKSKQIISYGSGPHEVYANSLKKVLHNNTIYLNQQHLSSEVTTIYEELSKRELQAASINGLIYRGDTTHTLQVPKALSRMGLLPQNITMQGPELLSLGVLSQYNKQNDSYNYPWHRYGFNNTFTVNELAQLLTHRRLPPFTLAYFPDADASLHKHGPGDIDAIEHADQTLQELFHLFDTWEKALQEVIWVVMGDSGQSSVGDNKQQALLDMNELLTGYSLWSRKEPNGQLALALNERMGYIHILDSSITYDELTDVLKKDKRISFLAWQENGTNMVTSPHHDGMLRYAPQGKYTDSYQQTWNIDGELSILDLKLKENQLIYGQYPDALARLHGALHAQQGKFIIIDLQPSHELKDEISYNHAGGGSHGSLHEKDSVVPLIAAGADIKLTDERLVALKQWLIAIVKRHNDVSKP